MPLRPLTVAITTVVSAGATFATGAALANDTALPELIVIEHSDPLATRYVVAPETNALPDSGELLKRAPGANLNKNGPLTGIVQYRGSYGDRVAVHIDHAPVVGGGPNAMDAPLSYAPANLLEELEVYRGIVSVDKAQETLGGYVHAQTWQAAFNDSNRWRPQGRVNAGAGSVNDNWSGALALATASDQHLFQASVLADAGDDTRYDDDLTITPSEYQRQRYDLGYGFRREGTELRLRGGHHRTDDSGTPALPMDIIYIDTDLASAQLTQATGTGELQASLAWNDVEHVMNNFSLRTPPMMGMQYRSTFATGSAWSGKLAWSLPLGASTVKLGVDHSATEHSAVISNPNNAMFEVVNFNNAQRDITGLFGQWQTQSGDWQWELGARVNQVSMDADEVSSSGMMGMMAMNAMTLANRFNNADRAQDDTNIDWVIKTSTPINADWQATAALARKTRAPSYQERYLWLPMEATAGLADGRVYLGNIALDSEVAHELNLGLDWQHSVGYFSPQVFYRQVSDYIQGTPSNDMTANMVATMMNGQPALQFNNVDAELYGADLAFGYWISDQQRWRIDGVASYVRGERTDIDDNLYRIAPPNLRLGLTYQQTALSVTVEGEAYAEQSDVAVYNDEEATGGYVLWHLMGKYQPSQAWLLSAGVSNLFDRAHQNHLSGYNRVAGVDIAQGERLYGPGRNLYAKVQYRF